MKSQTPGTSWLARLGLGAVSPGYNKGVPIENLKTIIKSLKSMLFLFYVIRKCAAILNNLSDKILLPSKKSFLHLCSKQLLWLLWSIYKYINFKSAHF